MKLDEIAELLTMEEKPIGSSEQPVECAGYSPDNWFSPATRSTP
jgi:hypothetical protein